MINESLARQAKENMSHDSYKDGSATSEFNRYIADVKEQIEHAKTKVSEEGKQRLDNLLIRHTTEYANWINKYNANGAGHVSSFISGAANYDMRRHQKYLNKLDKLFAEYDKIKDISSQIHAIVTGDKIIKSDDKNAVEKLQEKLAKAQEEHQGYKDYNINARKEKKPALPAYVLSNSNGRIKAIKDRLARLERLAAVAEVTPKIETEINGVKIVDNMEAQRLQMFFDGKPSAEIRKELKSNGFRWTPSAGAWQCYRNHHAMTKAERIASMA